MNEDKEKKEKEKAIDKGRCSKCSKYGHKSSDPECLENKKEIKN